MGNVPPPVPVIFAGAEMAIEPDPVPILVISWPVTVMLPPSEARNWSVLSWTLAQVKAVEGFMTAASPGLVPVFQNNRHYPTYEAYVEAIAAAMQAEYEAIVGAGFVLQLDCPDLAMAHHTSFQDLSESDFLTFTRERARIGVNLCRIRCVIDQA